MLKYRLITAFVLAPMVIAAVCLLPFILFAVFICVVCILSAWEWGKLAGFTSSKHRILLAILFGVLLGLMILTIPPHKPWINIWQTKNFLYVNMIWWLTAFLMVWFYPTSAAFWRGSRLLRVVFGLLTILPFFVGTIALRQYHYDLNHYTGAWWLLYVLSLVWGADSGAYIFGRAIGRHKLSLKVSPGKTWEGMVGGLLTSSMIAYLYFKYAPLNIQPMTLFVCSVHASMASILGDLTESMLKREAGIKDSGDLLRGHGGILDRIDSLTAAVPVFAYLIFLVFNAV